MLPGFNAIWSIYRSRIVYRGDGTSTVAVQFPGTDQQVVPALGCPSGFLGTPPNCYTTGLPGSDHCATACASSCQSVQNLQEYNFCYQQCYDACTRPPGGTTCTAPPGSCNAVEYCQCVKQNQNLPPNSPKQACGILFGPCHSPSACCRGTCSNLEISPLNCGRCGNECANDGVCCGGVCCGGTGENKGCCAYTGRTTADGLGVDTCVDLLPSGLASGESDNIYNCGTCGTVCPAGPANSSVTCVNGTCGWACNSDYTNCGGLCVQCPAGGICSRDNCVCPSDTTLCGSNPGVCENLQTSSLNCGSCGNSCVEGSGCIDGKCPCPGPNSRTCGNCSSGIQTRKCLGNGSWTAWSACTNQTGCTPGTSQKCGANGTQTCNNSCQWGTCSCVGPTSQPCGSCGSQTRTCDSGTWSGWSACSGQHGCKPGTTLSCGTNSVQTCNSSCAWEACRCAQGSVACGGSCCQTANGTGGCGNGACNAINNCCPVGTELNVGGETAICCGYPYTASFDNDGNLVCDDGTSC